jgi:hypothetical protein
VPDQRRVVAQLNAPTQNVTVPIINVDIRLCTGKHSLAIVTTQQTYKAAPLLSQGAPVWMTWGRSPSATTVWYGYVNHYEVVSDDRSSLPQVVYVLIGTSVSMNNETSEGWQGITDSYIVREIATRNNASSIVHATNQVWTYVAQQGSDFTFINELGQQDGRRVWADNCVVYYLDPLSLLQTPLGATIPSFAMDGRKNDGILKFNLVQGSAVPATGVQATRTAYGIDPSGNLLSARASSSAATLTKNYMPRPLGSYTDATNALMAAQRVNSGWVSASAQVLGDVRLQPGQVVYLSGRMLDADSTGLWLIDSAEHSLQPTGTVYTSNVTGFTTKLSLTRNQQGAQVFSDVIPVTRKANLVPPTLTNDGLWRAGVLEGTIYGPR